MRISDWSSDVCSSDLLALLVTRNFPPLLGGMEKVNQHLLAALRSSWRTALCGPAGCAAYASPQTEVRQSKVKPLPLFLAATLWHAVRLAWRRKPEWVIAGRRSEERRVGKECVRMCRSRGSTDN